MLQNLSGMHLAVIVFMVVLLFGAPKLPVLAKSLGRSLRILKQEAAGETAAPERIADPAVPFAAQPAARDAAERPAVAGDTDLR
ncbi:twin-arginine translocase TatA/TatE family subunit [Leucobacter soli]|uniref:Sec-independent protein translocase protein TatA n=1 Tax=Leucobacter soli TaxID=2812850 RepID=A0A916JZ37_9MICO|nr:twin-arginine translocase TatA/TatE family subunit [Leucobacter soli]CAG7617426.1 Sec-independent protein translocase protein TatA [Leucobacter soli]